MALKSKVKIKMKIKTPNGCKALTGVIVLLMRLTKFSNRLTLEI